MSYEITVDRFTLNNNNNNNNNNYYNNKMKHKILKNKI